MLTLPKLILLSDYQGNWELYLNSIYNVFRNDFIISRPHVPNRRVGLKKQPIEKEKEATFWHFVSTGEVEAERSICISRCERLPWIRPIIENYHASNINWWVEQKSGRKGNKKMICLTLHDFSYQVVLDDRGEFILPWTAYPIERQHQRDKLRKRWEESQINSFNGSVLFEDE